MAESIEFKDDQLVVSREDKTENKTNFSFGGQCPTTQKIL